jgi:hypothetical protein
MTNLSGIIEYKPLYLFDFAFTCHDVDEIYFVNIKKACIGLKKKER